MEAETVLEELSQDDLTQGHVVHRVEDWVGRINQLYTQIEQWLPERWTARPGVQLTVQEALMKKMGVPGRQLPTRELMYDGMVRGQLVPHALWIIGANGRIDLFVPTGLYLIVDRAKLFAPPDWQIAAMKVRQNVAPLSADTFRKILLA